LIQNDIRRRFYKQNNNNNNNDKIFSNMIAIYNRLIIKADIIKKTNYINSFFLPLIEHKMYDKIKS
jgi:hypothetical protein